MKKSMKYLTGALLSTLLFAGCTSGTTETTESSTPENSSDDKITIGIIQLIENGAFEDMREGFIAQLNEKGYDESKVTIDYKNAQGDSTNLNTMAQEMTSGDVDLIAAIATPPAQAVVNLESEIPTFFIAVSHPTAAGVITDMATPDKNATGVSNALPVEEIFDLALNLTPEIKTVGMLYSTNEINSITTVENAKEYLDSIGIAYVDGVVSNSSEVQQAAQSLVGKVDAIFVPNDSLIQSAMPIVSEVATEAKLPIYGSSATTVAAGAFATVAVSDEELGRIAADQAIAYLEGTPIEEIPAIVVPASDVVINEDVLSALELTIDEEKISSPIYIKTEAN